MVGDADELAQFQLVYPGLFPHFADGGEADVLPVLLMAFGKVPKTVPAYEQVIAPAVAHQPSCRVDLLEFGA